jgi:hypothetical protein
MVIKISGVFVTMVRSRSLGTSSGCTLVGPKTIEAAAKACLSLKSVNLNYTSVTPLALAPLLRSCKERLEVLKVAGINSWVLSRLLFKPHAI